MSPWTIPFALALLLCLPSATAGVHIDFPVAEVVVEDRWGTDCDATGGAKICYDGLGTDGAPGNWSLDLHESVRYAGAATNLSVARKAIETTPLGEELPRDTSYRASLQDAYIEHPAFRLAAPFLTYAGATAHAIHPSVNFVSNGSGLAYLYFFAPTFADPLGDWTRYEWTVTYSPGFEQSRIGPFHRLYYDESDTLFVLVEQTGCAFANDSCNSTVQPGVALGRDATPNATVGLDAYEVEIATNPGDLGSANQSTRSTSGTGMIGDARAADEKLLFSPLSRRDESSEPGAALPYAPGKAGPERDNPSTDPEEAPEFAAEEQDVPAKRIVIPRAAIAASTVVGVVVGLLALYRRIRSSQLAESETRAHVIEAVSASPGIRLSDLAQKLRVTHKGADYQVRRLAGAGMLVVVNVGRQKRLFVPGHAPRVELEMRVRDMVEPEPSRRIVAAIAAADKGLTRSELFALSGVPTSTFNWNLRRLLSAGRVVESQGRLHNGSTGGLSDVAITAHTDGSRPAPP